VTHVCLQSIFLYRERAVIWRLFAGGSHFSIGRPYHSHLGTCLCTFERCANRMYLQLCRNGGQTPQSGRAQSNTRCVHDRTGVSRCEIREHAVASGRRFHLRRRRRSLPGPVEGGRTGHGSSWWTSAATCDSGSGPPRLNGLIRGGEPPGGTVAWVGAGRYAVVHRKSLAGWPPVDALLVPTACPGSQSGGGSAESKLLRRACDCPRAAAPAGMGPAWAFSGSAAQPKILVTRPPRKMAAQSRNLPIAHCVGGKARSDRSTGCARHKRCVDDTVVVEGSAIAAPSSLASSIPFSRSARLLRRRSRREPPRAAVLTAAFAAAFAASLALLTSAALVDGDGRVY